MPRQQAEISVIERIFQDDGSIPNNQELPLLLYEGALEPDASSPSACKELFAGNGWTGAWVNGVFPYHHYHSTAHEVLGVVGGSARIILGGEKGEAFEVKAGDVIVIPAGVGHCNDGSSGDFRVVGAYADGRSWDLCTGKPEERPGVLENIKTLPTPDVDPVYGRQGPLADRWRASK